VSQIVSTQEQEFACAKRELFVISFIKDKMTLPVPPARIMSVGMRKLAEPPSASSTRPRSIDCCASSDRAISGVAAGGIPEQQEW